MKKQTDAPPIDSELRIESTTTWIPTEHVVLRAEMAKTISAYT